MKRWMCIMLCVGLLLAHMASARAEDTVDGSWVLSEPFVPRTAPKATPAEPEEQPDPPSEEPSAPQPEPGAARGAAEMLPESEDTAIPGPEDASPVAEEASQETKARPKAEANAEAEPIARPALEDALSFRQDGAPDLRYKWDAHTKMWSAEPLPPVAYPVYVINNAEQTVGPFAVSASADATLDDGGLFRLEARLFETAQNLTLPPNSSACIGEFVFSGSGGQTATASADALVIHLTADYLD